MKKSLVWYLVLVMCLLGAVPRVEAAFSPSEMMLVDAETRANDMEKIQLVLENKLVRERFQDLGFSVEEINSRLAALTAEQIHDLATKLETLKVGGDGGAMAAMVVVMVILVAAVMVWLFVTGRWFWRHS